MPAVSQTTMLSELGITKTKFIYKLFGSKQSVQKLTTEQTNEFKSELKKQYNADATLLGKRARSESTPKQRKRASKDKPIESAPKILTIHVSIDAKTVTETVWKGETSTKINEMPLDHTFTISETEINNFYYLVEEWTNETGHNQTSKTETDLASFTYKIQNLQQKQLIKWMFE